jgi:hypothetical protein
MGRPEPERTGVLVVRVWLEGPPETGFRARVTSTPDLAGHEEFAVTAATPEDVYRAVRIWLEQLVAPIPRTG